MNIKIDFFLDNNETKHGNYIDGVEIISPSRLSEMSETGVIIAVANASAAREIVRQLTEQGFDNFYVYKHAYSTEGMYFPDFYKTRMDAYKNLGDKFCPTPFECLYLYNSYSTVCCPQYIRITSGDLRESSIEEIWNSPFSRQIRASVIDGSYCFCDMDICTTADMIERDKLSKEYIDIVEKNETLLKQGPKVLNIGIDASCNLACKMCRPDKIIKNCEEQEILTEKIVSHKWNDVEKIILAGDGEVFFSKYYKKILDSISEENFPKLKTIVLYTNGNLLNDAMWKKHVAHLENKYEIEVTVSVDAYTAETYNKIRRGGSFESVVKNLEMIAEKRRYGTVSKFSLNFCTQNDNYKEMPDFVDWAKRLSADRIWFQILRGMEFEDNVHIQSHPNHKEFLQILKDPRLHENWIDISQLTRELEDQNEK